MNGGKSNSEVYSLFIKEKAGEASLRRSLTQAGKERDNAYNEMKKSQSKHQLAVAKHEKLQHELEQKKMTVELIYDAWKRIDAVNNNVDSGGCNDKKMDGINDKVDVVRGCDNDTVGISMPVVDHDGNVSVSVGQNKEKARDASLPVGVGIHVGVDNDGKNDVLTKGLVGAGNAEGDGRCGTGEIDNEEEANDALLVQAAKKTEALLVAGQIKRVSAREVSSNLNMGSGFGGDDGVKSGSTLSLASQDAGSPGRKKASSALAVISPERQVNDEVTNKTTKKKASAPHLDIGSVDSLKPAAALPKRARKAK